MDRKTGRTTFYKKAGGPGELSGTWILSIVEDRSGYLWFGTLGAGLNRLDRRTGKFKVFRHDAADPHSLSQNTVAKLFVDGRGVLWAGTDDGLDAFDPATESFRTYKAQGLGEMRVRDIAEDSQGALWIALRATGVLRLDPVTRQFTTYQHTPQPGSLSSDKTWAVSVDRAGIVWIGTESGLNRFDPATGAFTTYYESDGLADNSVSHILEDERGDLWVSTHNGLSRFNPREKTFQNYYTSDGLAGNEFYDNSSNSKSPGGEMFFSANGGLTAFFPLQVIDDPTFPPVVITDFKIFGNSVAIGGKSPLQRAISFTDRVTLSHQQNVLSLEFSALSYISPERNRYRYRMESMETKWNETEGSQRSVTYALPPGEYVFRVQGANRRGAWNEQGARVRFVISPPWWNTWQFRTAAMAFILLSLAYAYHLRLQNLNWQYTMRVEERVGERTRIARELHDTLLQSFQGLMLQFQVGVDMLPAGRAREALEKALERGDQAIAEGRDAIHDLRSPTADEGDLAQAVTALGDELASQDSATFHVTVEGSPRNLHPILRDEICRIAREAVRNAFRHAQARRIEAEIAYGDKLLRVRIRDDGKGMEPGIVEEGVTGHYGLPGMRERATRIGGQLNIWTGIGAGTEIELAIPGPLAYGTPAARTWWHRLQSWKAKRNDEPRS
jgi:signal transduction histidine kinase/streptogramin lyase